MSKFFNKIIYFDTITSTNDYLIRLYKEFDIKSQLVVFSNKQTLGRGRIGKKWFSGDGLSFSFSIDLNKQLDESYINMLVSLALVKILRKINLKALVKYPNDIIIGNKKISGILIENISFFNKKYSIIGIGLNVNNIFFPKNILNAISIKNLKSMNYNKKELLHLFLLEMEHLIQLYSKNKFSIKKKYMSVLFGHKKYVSCLYKGVEMKVKILSLTSKGLLTILTQESITYTGSSSDIKFLLN